jgi:hypothetical protein
MAQTECHNCGYPWAVQGGNCPNCGASNGCFITTAVCNSLGKSDNCEELELLRQFRDQFILTMPNGKSEIDYYYLISPDIVSKIMDQQDSDDLFKQIHLEYIAPAIQLIKEDKKHDAYLLYKLMVSTLTSKYPGV